MQCAICAALNREHSQECEAEATATLKQRAHSLLKSQGDAPGQDVLDPIVLISRKRQAHIVFKLHQHRTEEHCDEEISRAATA